MSERIEAEEICKNCLMFEESPGLCIMCSILTDPDNCCGDFLDKLEFGEEML